MDLSFRKLKRLAILITGWVSILVGIIGIFVPFVPGFAFFCAGLCLLSSGSHRARTTIQRMIDCLPSKLGKVLKILPGVVPELKDKASFGND